MSRICFVSYEIHPTTWGGCGVLLHNAARVLLAQGHEVLFLLDVPEPYFRRFADQDRLRLPHPERCRAYHVDALCAGIPLQERDFPSLFAWKAYRFHFACQQVYAAERPDVFEFFDYCGVAYYALSAKAAGSNFERSHLAIRLHNSVEMMDVHEATKPLRFDRYTLYALEHSALRLAESVLYPSPSYLRDGYRPHYEEWFGRAVCSQPPLVVRPQAALPRRDADVALFYGRLFTWKGVDLFVDAAIAYLENAANPPLQFYLVGNDSGQAPIDVPDYKTYLLRKIPPKHQQRFAFTGWLDWQQLAGLLPRVRFGVFPSYFESFCYALHEVYLARIPVIVSDKPGTRDFFCHEQNALLFDGSVEDLTRQMERLAADADLRDRLTLPYPVATAPMGDFYERPLKESWIERQTPARRPSLLVGLIEDGPERTAATLEALAESRVANMRVIRLRAADEDPAGAATWLLGALRTLHDHEGNSLLPTEVRTGETLLILRGGDVPHPEYLGRCLDTLARQPQIAFVGSWKQIVAGGDVRIEAFPLDAVAELAPLRGASPFSRYVLRTVPDKLLIDLFPPSAGLWGESAYLWDLDSGRQCGLTIPEVLLSQPAEPAAAISQSTLAYLVLRDKSPWRKTRLTRYLLELWAELARPAPPTPSPAGQHRRWIERVRSGSRRSVGRALRTFRPGRIRAVGKTCLKLLFALSPTRSTPLPRAGSVE